MTTTHTPISTIGEFGLIDRIRKVLQFRVDDSSVHNQLIKGISDDTAVFRPTPGMVQLFTMDALTEGIHFDLTFTGLQHLGWKAMAVNLSDIAAMGGIPRYAVVTIALPQKISVEMVEEFYRGIAHASKEHSCLVIGGDTITTLGNMTISVAMTGEVKEENIIYRKGAKPGDYICVTGHLGGSVAGLKVLQREKERFLIAGEIFQPNLEPYKFSLEKHLMPKPRLDITKLIVENGIKVNAMIDVSDGLASEVHHLCRQSNVGVALYEHNVPVEHETQRIASEFGENVIDYALYGGEEYELLFTMSDTEYEKLSVVTSDVTILGRMQEKDKGIELVNEQGEHSALAMKGWEHFGK